MPTCNRKYLRSKILSVLLALMFVLTVLVSCSDEEDASSSPESSLAVSSEASSEAESSLEEESSVAVSEEESSFAVSEEESSLAVSEDETSPVVSEEESSEPEESSEIIEESSEDLSEDVSFDPSWLTPEKEWGSGWRESPFDYDGKYTTPENIEDNIFWDSLIYTGYNIKKHYADDMMWEYILAEYKRDYGWLSDIGYAGGSLGYETTEDGLPDIEFFEEHGLVCASYVAYVYYNYLPNVAGIDTSVLAKPTLSYSANDIYLAAQQWVEDGYSRYIEFEATNAGGFIKYEPVEDIPIGSILCFCDNENRSDFCRHVCIYAGYKNGYHWVYHVGNDNGPEFCAVERMTFGPGPQWPIAIISTPDFILEAME